MRSTLPLFPAIAPAAPVHAGIPAALAALGPLLCLHGDDDPHLLSGWRRAATLVAAIGLDNEGPSEALRFFDADGACCWQLHLLPDSDFLAWETLLARLPVAADGADARIPSWAWRRRLRPRWRACPLRLHALHEDGGGGLAVVDTRLSPLGRICAGRIARQAGIDAMAVEAGSLHWRSQSMH